MVDGAGYLHLSWDHHGHPLRYARSTAPYSTEFSEPQGMTGHNERNVTYPQFFRLPSGNLLFFFRNGASGRGDLVLNRYDVVKHTWSQLHANLIGGEGKRNAYWQATIGIDGSVHVSWVWRESGDVASNHDLCYARSDDDGLTWKRSDGRPYAIPIVASEAEIAAPIPQNHELINQTSMCTDSANRPMIATYYRPPGTDVVQYALVLNDGDAWRTLRVSDRRQGFTLSGVGSKQIPISRPQLIAWTREGRTSVAIFFRDIERDMRVSMTVCPDVSHPVWTVSDLTSFSVDYWEPSFDRNRWHAEGVVDLFVQKVGQGDGERLEEVPAQPAQVLEYRPLETSGLPHR
jgi:hypothetical protein